MIADRSLAALLRATPQVTQGILTSKWYIGEAFDSLESEWRAAHTRFEGNLFASWEWLNAWRRVVGTGGTVRTLVLKCEDEVVGIFPFILPQRTRPWELVRMRPLGYHGATEANGLTEEPIALFDLSRRDEILDHLRTELDAGLRRRDYDLWIASWFEPVETPVRPVTQRSHWHRVKGGSHMVDLSGDWCDFRRRLTKSMRDNLTYYRRLLTREGHTFEVQFVDSELQFDWAVDHLIDLHHRRTKCEKGPRHADYFPTDTQRQMMRKALGCLAAQRKGFLAMLLIDGKPAAAQGFLQSKDRLTALYSGFDPAVSRYSPLLVLQTEVFQRAQSEGVRTVDLLMGHALWQSRWQPTQPLRFVREYGLRESPLAYLRAGIYAIRREWCRQAQRRGWTFAMVPPPALGATMPFLQHAALRVASSPVTPHLMAHARR